MSKQMRLSRRTVLKGFGTVLALPMLEAMMPLASLAAPSARKAPTRMAFLYVPNGVNMSEWTPAAEGPLQLTKTLQPLAPVQEHVAVLSGLTLDKARPNGDGPGDHARAMSAFLTGCQPRKTFGADIKVGVSVDQLAASRVGKQTRFPSLELGIERGLNAGNCDSGYSCAYSANLSWRTESMPVAKEINPRLVFERLFASQGKGEADAARAKRERYRLSVLDFVMEDATSLKNRLGATDQRKLEEYLTAVREIEVRIARADAPKTSSVGLPKPPGIPTDYEEHIHLMCDLLVLAFQGDLTRIATLPFANDGSNRSYRPINVPEGHHDLSHHGGNKDKLAKIQQINAFHIRQLAYLLQKMKEVKEGEGTLLDHAMVLYGSGIGDGNRHNHDNLPIILAGKGGGAIRTGRHVRYAKETPLTNLYVAMLEIMGAPTKQFGDSRGRLEI